MVGMVRNSSLTQGYKGLDLRLCMDQHCLPRRIWRRQATENRDLAYDQSRCVLPQLCPRMRFSICNYKINAQQTMYGKYAFKPLALLYFFSTKAKQENIPLVQIQKVVGLLGSNHLHDSGLSLCSVNIATSCHRAEGRPCGRCSPCSQGPGWPALTRACAEAGNSFNLLSERRRKEVVSKS